MDHIDEYLATASQNVNYSEAIRAALALGKRTLNRYYDKTDHSEVYRIAMGKFLHVLFISFFLQSFFPVLHPRHKLHYFKKAGWQEDWIETARDIVRAEFDHTYAFMDVDVDDPDSEPLQSTVRIFLHTSKCLANFSFSVRRPHSKTSSMSCQHFLPPQNPTFVMSWIVISAPIPSMSPMLLLGGTRSGLCILASIVWRWIT